MKNNKTIALISGGLLLGLGILIIALFEFPNSSSSIVSFDLPTHQSNPNCTWAEKIFTKSGITFFAQTCPGDASGLKWIYNEDVDRKITITSSLNSFYRVTLQVFSNKSGQRPVDVVDGYYRGLTSDQQASCEVKDANIVEKTPDGKMLWTEEPHPVKHKTRYKIAPKKEVLQAIIDKYGEVPSQYDFMCGKIVGSSMTSHAPYFEFDDRSPNKYLFVGAIGQDDPPVDLNSIRF